MIEESGCIINKILAFKEARYGEVDNDMPKGNEKLLK